MEAETKVDIKDDEKEVVKLPEDFGIKSKNMFTKIFGPKYAYRFAEIYGASIVTREEAMKKLYDDINADENMTEAQKKIAAACYIAFKEALCINTVSTPIIAYLDKKKPVLIKMLKDSRIKRTASDLYDLFDDNGFECEVARLPLWVHEFEKTYTTGKNASLFGVDGDYSLQCLILAAFSKFYRSLNPNNVATKWYIMLFIKNIEYMSTVIPEFAAKCPTYKNQVVNLLKTIYMIQRLEFKRAGLVEDKMDEVEEKAAV